MAMRVFWSASENKINSKWTCIYLIYGVLSKAEEEARKAAAAQATENKKLLKLLTASEAEHF